MLTKVRAAIDAHNMIAESDKVIVALSGGADSIALLQVLFSLQDELGISLSACHLNHNLRGEESDSDERFVRAFCEQRGIPLIVESIDVLAKRSKHQSVEECARNVRYDFFKRISDSAKIATAHTASDNVETVMLNMVRGTALKGLCGIPPVRENIIRPLIYCLRKEIEQYCMQEELSYVTDSTNLSDEYTRNFLRRNVVPELQKLNPSFETGITRMVGQLRQDEEYLSEVAEERLKAAMLYNDRLDISVIKSEPLPILHRIILQLLSHNNISPSSHMVQQIGEIIVSGSGKLNICKHYFAVVKKGEFFIEYAHQNYRK